MSYVICHISYIVYRISCIVYHISYIVYQLSYIIIIISVGRSVGQSPITQLSPFHSFSFPREAHIVKWR